jgi:hypothetical protein
VIPPIADPCCDIPGARYVRRVLRLTILGALCVALLAVPSTSRAGTYLVYSCKDDTGAPAGVADWQVASAGDGFTNGCARWPLVVDLFETRAHAAGASGELRFDAPPATTIQDWVLYRSAQVAPGYAYELVEHKTDGSDLVWERCLGSSGCSAKGDWARHADQWKTDANKKAAFGRSASNLRVRVVCAAAGGSCGAVKPGAELQLHQSQIRLVDDIPPTIAAPAGGGLTADDAELSGDQSFAVTAGDRGGGAFEAGLRIDGRDRPRSVLDANGGACAKPFKAKVPCPATASGVVSLNTRTLTNGPHTIQLTVTDAAGNITVGRPVRVRVANITATPQGAPPADDSCNRTRAPAGTRHLTAHFTRGRKSLSVRYGRGARVSGRLRDGATPVGGATLCVLLRDDVRGAVDGFGGTVTTNDKGLFEYKLPVGPSRIATFVYRTPEGAVLATVKTRVSARVTLRRDRSSVRGGRPITFRGSVLGGPSAAGLVVELQAPLGKGWQEFATARTSDAGRFRITYRFTRVPRVRHFRIRVRVRKQGAYPYATGASRPVRVTVRG